MPFRISAPGARPTGPGRRSVLAGAAVAGAPLVALLAGCTSGHGAAPAARTASRDTLARRRAAADTTALLTRYDAVLAAHPQLSGRLAPLRTQVAAHAAAFGARPTAATAAPSATGSPSARPPGASGAPSAPPSAARPPVPAAPRDALRSLADAERDTAARRVAGLPGASPELARLLASVAACGAGHVALLTGADR